MQPHNMPSESRWQLYFYWLTLYRNQLSTKLETLAEEFRVYNRQYSEVRSMEDVKLMKQMLVV